MYKDFYGLTRSPFDITPDPAFMFVTEQHNEAFANLYCGLGWRKGVIVLTGEAGTGKTLLVRCVLNAVSETGIEFAYVINGRVGTDPLIETIALDFGISVSGSTQAAVLNELQTFLIDRHMAGLTTAVVIDEAHNLSIDALEEIRMLTNLETAQRKLLQVLLVGQPELDNMLDSQRLRQLKQRIALRCRLEPLSCAEVQSYIEQRLQIAGANGRSQSLFPAPTANLIHRYSGGIPRLINVLCDNALIAGFSRGHDSIETDIIDEVAGDLRLCETAEPCALSPELTQTIA